MPEAPLSGARTLHQPAPTPLPGELARLATSDTEPTESGLNDPTTLSMLASDQPASRSYQYKAFISYSHDADSQLARSLQGGLHRFAKPWYRRRAIRVFRDETNLNVNPRLWSTIKEALGNAEIGRAHV